MIMVGTKKITSLDSASRVDLRLDPMDCNTIDNDLVILVRIIPPRKILKQYFAYSKYSKEFPKIFMIPVGKNSNNIKAIQPIIKFVCKIYFIVSFTLLIFFAPMLYPIIGIPPKDTPITTDITIPNTFIHIPITARGVTTPYGLPELAIVPYPYLLTKLFATAMMMTIASCVMNDANPKDIDCLHISFFNLSDFLLI